jgi:hypothetical protein
MEYDAKMNYNGILGVSNQFVKKLSNQIDNTPHPVIFNVLHGQGILYVFLYDAIIEL